MLQRLGQFKLDALHPLEARQLRRCSKGAALKVYTRWEGGGEVLPNMGYIGMCSAKG